MKWWGWLGTVLLAVAVGLLVWRGFVAPPPPSMAPALSVVERLDRIEVLGSLAFVVGAGLLAGALHRPRHEGT